MEETIWKYDIIVNDLIHLQMPEDAEILCIQVQNGNPCIWAKVNPENKMEKRSFLMFGTGHRITNPEIEKKYIGTFQLGSFVGHLFELIQK